ncbi:glycoside hydrolase family 71 protein [Aulographum hederae CBS 113979]|uniref:Glycoside hydrolase family 71 protein n=1 Tax=Aulographum hederae CBS 113979 TaxID=1176131 RepID=A0A6G1H7P4_9PEZI|nr:glycoside hydrolase family 71 protein [Aulographum hederae CBS 113979]
MARSLVCALFALLACLATAAQAGQTFAHYMVGTTTEAHVKQDIDEAAAAGFDAFALNVGDPTAAYANTTVGYMFKYLEAVQQKYPFKLFISMDLAAHGTLNDFTPMVKQYIASSAYRKAGSPAKPFLSTFSGHSNSPSTWNTFLSQFSPKPYFIPNFDNAPNYFDASDSFWSQWNSVVDGLFSWETAWPKVTEAGTGSITQDQKIASGASKKGKVYMAPLSTLQYKNAYGGNWYRNGETNFPVRMKDILNMKPAFTEVITWNDGPESHYVGNLFPEQNSSPEPAKYASPNNTTMNHKGWLPLIKSFTATYKAGKDASQFFPASGKIEGAFWYKSIMQAASCSGQKPQGFNNAHDILSWAILLPANANGYKARFYTSGKTVAFADLKPWLNYGGMERVQAGAQTMEVIDGSWRKVFRASGGRELSNGCPDGIYNMNAVVVGLKAV